MNFKKNRLGWYTFIFLSLSPIIIWICIEPLLVRFDSTATIFTSLGEITGLIGMTMFSLDFVLSTRLKVLEQYFGGMNKVYLAHHIFGGVAFILLLVHPLFLAAVYMLDSLKSAALFLLPGTDWTINLGITALFLMMGLLVLTFFTSLPYNVWKFSHKFLGLAFFIGAVHGLFVSSDISKTPLLKAYMLIFLGIGIVSYIYKTLLGWLFIQKSLYRVTNVKKLGSKVAEIDLQNEKKPIRFVPGQFVFISFRDPTISKESHPFSISSAPDENNFSVTVKAEGDYTKKLLNILPGAKAYIEGAFGNFEYEVCPNPNQIWIAGGIGIAPFLAMAKTLKKHQSVKVDLYYSMHDQGEAVYVEQLKDLLSTTTNLSFAPYYTSQHGRLTGDLIARASGDIERKDFFICGPPMMMRGIKEQLRKLKVPLQQIHSEEFQWE